jgi:hypothetical protein
MKASALMVVCLLAVSIAGCVQAPLRASLEHAVIPPLTAGENDGQSGLVVYSAYDAVPFSASESYSETKYHSDYEISGAGGFFAKVRNRDRAFDATPPRTNLAPGRYQVVAKVNGFGRVEIPIVILPGQVTTLHVEGVPAPTGQSAPLDYDLVRIPDGRVVGWCILGATSPRP